METYAFQRTDTQVQVNSFIQSVYNWMAAGLGITGFIAFAVANSSLKYVVLGNPFILWGMIIAEFVIVFFLAARVDRMTASTATGLFILYSALNGATLSSIFIVYTFSSIASTFFICAGTFVVCSIYGMVTQKDLTSMGSFFFMGLIGIVIASVVNMFFRSPFIAAIISYIGVFVFVGLTAYDTQKLKMMALAQPDGLDTAIVRKGSILGALTLYLDFINMFIFMLQIFGVGSDD
ncbi:MAG: Bax inhibitor-1/YccA family protein [Candidatus Magnetomorum sp.]|nr:Bax inhibitor-1/YccA family protein [Candidatus Magnetomorum sp.]